MVRTLALAAALALVGSAAAAKNTTSSKFTGKLAALEMLSNKTDEVKDEAWEMAAWKLNKTVHMADKVFEYKNKTDKALNLSKFEDHVDAKFDMLIEGLNETYQKIEGAKEEVEAKVEEPVKMVDDKIDMLRMELEEKLMMLKNTTFGVKEMVEEKIEGIMTGFNKDE